MLKVSPKPVSASVALAGKAGSENLLSQELGQRSGLNGHLRVKRTLVEVNKYLGGN